MSRSLKSRILVVLMFAHAVSDLQINVNISDSKLTSPLPEAGRPGPPSHGPTGMGFGNNSTPPPFPMEEETSSGPPEENGDLSEKQKKSQLKHPNAQLSSCTDFAPSEIHVNTSECNDTSDMDNTGRNEGREISEEAERDLTGPVLIIFIPSFFTLVFIISAPLNICAVLVIGRRVKPKKPASIFMLNLACADLLFAVVLPFKISYHFNGNNWIFGSAMCHLVTAAFFLNMYCSVLLIACMSVDRLLAVVYPVRSLSWRSPKKAVIVCVAMWVLSFAGSMPLFFYDQAIHLNTLNITTCHDMVYMEHFGFYRLYFIIVSFLLFFLPLIITAVSYTLMIKTLSKAQTGVTGPDRKKRRAVALALTVLVIFVICFTPTNCVNTVRLMNFDYNESLYIFYQVFQCLGSLNCLLDPLVYYFGSSKFKKELCSMLGRQKTTQSTSGPSVSTSHTALKSNCKEVSETNTLLINSNSSQSNLA